MLGLKTKKIQGQAFFPPIFASLIVDHELGCFVLGLCKLRIRICWESQQSQEVGGLDMPISKVVCRKHKVFS